MKKMRTTTTTLIDVEKDFYCSQKFWWLSVDLEKLETFSCCAARPTRIDFEQLKQQPGNLFNSPVLQSERLDMLDNKPVSSCSTACWIPESKSLVSRRIATGSDKRTHLSVDSSPETLNVLVGTDCNMTCVYCCKHYSSSWARDINDHGPYSVETSDDRFKFTDRDRVIMKLSQKEIGKGQHNNALLDEIRLMYQGSQNLSDIEITGGEPFLHLGLEDLVSRLTGKGIPVKIWSGLGVDPTRFKKEIEKLLRFPEVEIVVSAESTGQIYELLRNGNTWERFKQNIATLENLSVRYSFYSVITNLTLFGIKDFLSYAGDKKIQYNLCANPSFLSANVLDDGSKQKVLDELADYPDQLCKILSNNLAVSASPTDRDKLKTYLSEFARRRNLDLDFLPATFKKWIDWKSYVV